MLQDKTKIFILIITLAKLVWKLHPLFGINIWAILGLIVGIISFAIALIPFFGTDSLYLVISMVDLASEMIP